MIIAGPCLYVDESDTCEIVKTEKDLIGYIDYFRVKFWGGGTKIDRYFPGYGSTGIDTLTQKAMNTLCTEVQTPEHIEICSKYNLPAIWVGARNCQNYALLEALCSYKGEIMIKRGPGITFDELCNLYDIINLRFKRKAYIIERGILTFDRSTDHRWTPDILTAMRLKWNRPDIFKWYIADCSHSAGKKEYVADIYAAFKSIGVKHFMFECTLTGESRTDKAHMLSTKELKEILR